MTGKARASRGFTLIGVVIALAVVAVLTSVAIPAFEDHVRRARRADAQAALMELAQRQERHHAGNARYAADLTLLGYSRSHRNRSATGHYEVLVEAPGEECPIERCFVLRAEPVAGSHQAADRVTALRLHSSGLRQQRIDGRWRGGWH